MPRGDQVLTGFSRKCTQTYLDDTIKIACITIVWQTMYRMRRLGSSRNCSLFRFSWISNINNQDANQDRDSSPKGGSVHDISSLLQFLPTSIRHSEFVDYHSFDCMSPLILETNPENSLLDGIVVRMVRTVSQPFAP